MFDSMVSESSSQLFNRHASLAYWVARKWCRKLLDRRARNYTANDLEELAQDTIGRAYDRLVKRCARQVCGKKDRKRWVCQCVVGGAHDAVRNKSRFGSISSGVAIRDDAMNRYKRIHPVFAHGSDDEKRYSMDHVHDTPLQHAAQRWELEEVAQRELPSHLRATAIYAACDLTQQQSATLQGCTDRTVRNRLRAVREYLRPQSNVYAIICDALQTCLDSR